MPKITYKEEEKIRDSAHLKGLLEQLPPFLFIYFRGIAQTTSVKTRIGYAYDLKVFFNFLCEKNDNFIGVDFEDINVSMLETITPQDIEEFLDYVTSYVPFRDTEEDCINNTALFNAEKICYTISDDRQPCRSRTIPPDKRRQTWQKPPKRPKPSGLKNTAPEDSSSVQRALSCASGSPSASTAL